MEEKQIKMSECDHPEIRIAYGEDRMMCTVCLKRFVYSMDDPDYGYRRVGPNLFRREEQTTPQDAS